MNIHTGLFPMLVVGMLLLSSNAIAQTQQTVEGAQAFLSQVVSGGQVNASLVINEVKMIQRTTEIEKKFMQGCVPTTTSSNGVVFPVQATVTRVTSTGSQCMTALSDLELRHKKYSHDYGRSLCETFGSSSKWEAVIPEISPAPVIDWSRATIERGQWRGVQFQSIGGQAYLQGGSSKDIVLVSAPDKNHGTIHFNMSASTELADRIEYAVKFLQMSCDPAAGTGF